MTDEGLHNCPSINLSDVLCFSLDYSQCQGSEERRTDSFTSTAVIEIILAFAILYALIGV